MQVRSLSKADLQRRLFELGQGQIHGKKGLPGVRGAGASGQADASTGRGSLLTHQKSKKVLVPGNLPFRVQIPRREEIPRARGGSLSTQLRGSEQLAQRHEQHHQEQDQRRMPTDPLDTLQFSGEPDPGEKDLQTIQNEQPRRSTP